MVRIITIPNDNHPVLNIERDRIVPWAAGHGWIYTGYNNENDHLVQIRRASGGAAIEVVDFDCTGNPAVFNGTSIATALQFGRSLAQIPGFSTNTLVYLDACNTGLTSDYTTVPIAQIVADGAGCTVYGTKGHVTGTFAEGTERCYRGPNLTPAQIAYPGAQDAVGRNVWIAFQPRRLHETDISELRSMTVGVDLRGRVWASFDPVSFREAQMNDSNSVTVHARSGIAIESAELLESIMRSEPVEFPLLRMAPDITINYVRDDQVRILDVFGNGGLLKDRISGKAWNVPNPAEFNESVLRNLR